MTVVDRIQSYSVPVLAFVCPITRILPILLYLISLSRRCNRPMSKLFFNTYDETKHK